MDIVIGALGGAVVGVLGTLGFGWYKLQKDLYNGW